MDRILIVSWHFPPAKSSSGFNLFKRIKDSGYEFDVIYQGDGAQFADNLAMFNGARSKFNLYRLNGEFKSPFDRESRENFIAGCLEGARELANVNHYRVMLSHSNEFVSHMAAARIKEEFPHLVWLASYGDPMGGNPYLKYYSHDLTDEDVAYEKSLAKLYDGIIVTNEYQRRLMAAHFGGGQIAGKFHALPHCFDPRFYQQKEYANDVFLFSHIGMLYKHKRSGKPFIEAVKHLLKTWPEYAGKFHMRFVGAQDSHIREYIESEGQDHVSFVPAVSWRQSIDMMCESDALLLRDADFTDDGHDFSPYYPGKLADYLGAGKPIIAVTMNKGFVADLCARHDGISYAEENDTVALANLLKFAIDGANKKPSCSLNSTTYQSGYIFNNIVNGHTRKKRILFAGHKLSFAQPIISYLQNHPDYEVYLDIWRNHTEHDLEESDKLLNNADIIFCEWGLGNSVWYSKNKKAGQKLIVRAHLQELNTKFIDDIDMDKVDYFIAITPHMYHEFQKRMNLPRDKIRMIFNVLEDEKFAHSESDSRSSHFGFIGYAPARKRLDYAVELFDELWRENHDIYLHVKGKDPLTYNWIKSKASEVEYYNNLFNKISTLACRHNIIFEPFGPDVPEFLSHMGYILSTSDFEGSHQSVAEGMAAGCVPIIRNWSGADSVYPQKYIFNNQEDMKSFIATEAKDCDRNEIAAYAKDRFSLDAIMPQLLQLF